MFLLCWFIALPSVTYFLYDEVSTSATLRSLLLSIDWTSLSVLSFLHPPHCCGPVCHRVQHERLQPLSSSVPLQDNEDTQGCALSPKPNLCRCIKPMTYCQLMAHSIGARQGDGVPSSQSGTSVFTENIEPTSRWADSYADLVGVPGVTRSVYLQLLWLEVKKEEHWLPEKKQKKRSEIQSGATQTYAEI